MTTRDELHDAAMRAAVERDIKRSRLDKGLPAQITDPLFYQRLAVYIRKAMERAARDATPTGEA